MAEFIALGIGAADKLVDKHFHKVPDKALQSQTYNPREIRKRYRRRRRRSTPSSSESDIEPPPPMSQDPRQNSVIAGVAPPPEYPYVPYSRDPPHLRPEYAPSPPPIGQPYFPPPPQSVGRSQVRKYEDDDEDDDGYYSDHQPRRPRALTHRSSSYHGPRRQDDDGYNDRQIVQRRRRGSSQDGSDTVSKSKDVAHRHGFKDEVEHYFTKSPAGITGAVAGAVVGGWVAKKAQVASGKEGKHHGSNPLLTLLGAAAGGLAVNAVIDKFEDRKKETADKQQAWEEKWGRGDERDDRRGRSDSSNSRRRRQRSRSYS